MTRTSQWAKISIANRHVESSEEILDPGESSAIMSSELASANFESSIDWTRLRKLAGALFRKDMTVRRSAFSDAIEVTLTMYSPTQGETP